MTRQDSLRFATSSNLMAQHTVWHYTFTYYTYMHRIVAHLVHLPFSFILQWAKLAKIKVLKLTKKKIDVSRSGGFVFGAQLFFSLSLLSCFLRMKLPSVSLHCLPGRSEGISQHHRCVSRLPIISWPTLTHCWCYFVPFRQIEFLSLSLSLSLSCIYLIFLLSLSLSLCLSLSYIFTLSLLFFCWSTPVCLIRQTVPVSLSSWCY